jgi:flagellar motor switch/type III secretory pathway protein FliN
VVGYIELASTALTVRDWLAVEVSDAIVFDGVKAESAQDVWSVKLRVGVHAASAHLDPTGDLRLRDGFRRAPVASGRILQKKRSQMPDRPAERTEETTAPMVLSSAPIEVVAELGRVELRGDEVLSLERGGVVTFAGLRATAPIALRIGGDVWAWGELVDVDGELGVRITDITARNDSASAKP